MRTTTWIYASETDCGRHRLTWTWPNESGVRSLAVTHSAELRLPAAPLTNAELNKWILNLLRGGTSVRQLNYRSVSEFIERVKFSDVATSIVGADRILSVAVENRSPVVLPLVNGRWIFTYDGLTRCIHPIQSATSASQILRNPGRLSITTDFRRDKQIAALTSQMPPEQYYLAICSWDYEITRFDGWQIVDSRKRGGQKGCH